jgi:kynurenine formamidase
MPIFDLTHPIQPDISVYPGDETPVITSTATIDHDGYQAHRLTFTTHSGTHIDAPAHILPKAKTLDQFPASHFQGRALVVDCRDLQGEISRATLEPLLTGQEVEFILLLTGWDRHWRTDAYLSGFPILSVEAAQWLANLNLKGIGLDALSIDQPNSIQLPNHRSFLAKEIVIIENLTKLATIPNPTCQLYCLPLLISGTDGAPARVFATV